MIKSRLVALAVCLGSFALVLCGFAGSIGSIAVAAIAAGLAILSVAILMRCFLDHCAPPAR